MFNKIVVSENLKLLAKTAEQTNNKIYVVGGFVRNLFAGIKTTDIDLAGTLTLQEIENVCKTLNFSCSIINKRLGTVLIKHKEEMWEYTTFRSETYGDTGKHSPDNVTFTTSLEQDSLRRDFTVSSIYYDILENKTIDPFNGLKDLQNKILKAIVSPYVVFQNDGLRLLRFVRQGCELNFKLDKLSLKVAKLKIGLLKDISKERILRELKLILNSDSTYHLNALAHKRAIELFNKLNAYQYIFNSQFKNVKISTKTPLFKAWLKTNQSNRYYVFVVMALHSFLKTRKTTNSNAMFLINTILGVNGLKESNENINKIVTLYEFYQMFEHEKTTNQMCIKFEKIAPQTQEFFNNLNAKKSNEIKTKINELKQKHIPFSLGDLKITNQELLLEGIDAKLIAKIKAIMFNECLNETLQNNKIALINFAKQIKF